MSEALSKNYLLEVKVSFLTMSFILSVIAIAVKYDIWPFLQTSLPQQNNVKYWIPVFFVFGFIIPIIWLFIDWKNKIIRYELFSIITMFLLQFSSEYLFAKYFFDSIAVLVAMLYIGYRIIQLLSLFKILNQLQFAELTFFDKLARRSVVGLSLCFWIFIWINMTFEIFPQIIYQIF